MLFAISTRIAWEIQTKLLELRCNCFAMNIFCLSISWSDAHFWICQWPSPKREMHHHPDVMMQHNHMLQKWKPWDFPSDLACYFPLQQSVTWIRKYLRCDWELLTYSISANSGKKPDSSANWRASRSISRLAWVL
jgi:hypothetical protein